MTVIHRMFQRQTNDCGGIVCSRDRLMTVMALYVPDRYRQTYDSDGTASSRLVV